MKNDFKLVAVKIKESELIPVPTTEFFFTLPDGVYKFVPISEVTQLKESKSAYSKQHVVKCGVLEANGFPFEKQSIVTLLPSVVKTAYEKAGKMTTKLFDKGVMQIEKFAYNIKGGRLTIES